MATALQKQIDKFQEEAVEYNEAREDALNAKTDYSLVAIGNLMSNLAEGIDELTECATKAEYYDKELCNTLKATVTKLVEAMSKSKPTVNVSSTVDLSAINSIAESISTQNKSLIGLLDKVGSGNKSDELHRLIVGMIGKQSAFLENAFKQIDYTMQFTQLISAIRETKPTIEKIDIVRNSFGVLQSINPVYKK